MKFDFLKSEILFHRDSINYFTENFFHKKRDFNYSTEKFYLLIMNEYVR